ncbi:MAG TPA: hypothetical protein VMJ90_08245 [Anaerolineales bacterium]|nr:hypothetical protein [Anaerolineales bacterium]
MDDHLKQNAPIENALASQPLAQMPRSVTADVLARIQTEARPSLLTWSDFFLSIVIAACIAASWFAAQNLPPIILAKLRIQSILLYQDFLVNARWLVPSLLFGIAATLAAMTIPSLIQMTMDRRHR